MKKIIGNFRPVCGKGLMTREKERQVRKLVRDTKKKSFFLNGFFGFAIIPFCLLLLAVHLGSYGTIFCETRSIHCFGRRFRASWHRRRVEHRLVCPRAVLTCPMLMKLHNLMSFCRWFSVHHPDFPPLSTHPKCTETASSSSCRRYESPVVADLSHDQ